MPAKLFQLLNKADNVATALKEADSGLKADIEGETIEVKEPIPFGHKIALKDIAEGQPIIKYGEIIGKATQNIQKGNHVDVHNMVGIRGQKRRSEV